MTSSPALAMRLQHYKLSACVADPCSPAEYGGVKSARWHGIRTAARVRARAADLLRELHQQLLRGR